MYIYHRGDLFSELSRPGKSLKTGAYGRAREGGRRRGSLENILHSLIPQLMHADGTFLTPSPKFGNLIFLKQNIYSSFQERLKSRGTETKASLLRRYVISHSSLHPIFEKAKSNLQLMMMYRKYVNHESCSSK